VVTHTSFKEYNDSITHVVLDDQTTDATLELTVRQRPNMVRLTIDNPHACHAKSIGVNLSKQANTLVAHPYTV
jgi:hypothetical protein